MLNRNSAEFPVRFRGGKGHVSKLVSMVEHVVAHGNIDDDTQEDAEPDGNVIGVETNKTPVGADPAPELRMS